MTLTGRCHCGKVSFTYHGAPEKLVACNCSICRRLAALWAHGPEGVVEIQADAANLHGYAWGDKGLAFYACKQCNCTTHWKGLGSDGPQNMAVNCRLCEPAALSGLRIRQFDGADSWKFLD